MITGRDLIELGWPQGRVIGLGLSAARALERRGESEAATLWALEAVREDPGRALAEEPEAFGELAREWMRLSDTEVADDLREKPLPYSAWGSTSIDAATILQMENALRLPVSVGGALMPDAHLGYGLPVGGVLATKEAVIPWAVGVDIAPLRGDTLIPTLDGKSYVIKDLADSGEEFGVWSCKPDGKIVASMARAFKTQKNAPLVKVTLYNGEKVECTPDHPFMLRNGSYVEAGRLKAGNSLMPFYFQTDEEGYLRIQQNYSGAYLRAHWIVARSGLMGKIPKFAGQRTVIHHENFDETDNRPQNLVFMGDKDHSRFHRGLVERNTYWQSEEFERKRIEALSAKAKTPEGHAEFVERARRMNEQIKADPSKQSRYTRTEKHLEIARTIGSRMFDCEICGKRVKSRIALAGHMRTHLTNGAYNHKVESVEYLHTREDVYCLDVPTYHNFAVSAGVFVHNCRLRLSVFDLSPYILGQRKNALKEMLVKNTTFGAGKSRPAGEKPAEHEVLDDPAWGATRFLKGLKDTGRAQLGTSGSGNHFVEWGVFEATGSTIAIEPLKEDERFLALLSHSGSRGVGFKIANRYSKIAKEKHLKLEKAAADLAWLTLSSEEGEEYWLSMELAGRYAAANHAVIHDSLAQALGVEPVFSTEHHHNFAWREEWRGEEVIVHRKGATPAGEGTLGIIPGTMADPGYLTLGLGNEDSVNSASHGAGRAMSRSQAFKTLDEGAWRNALKERGITLIGGSLDEAPGAYKRISEVMSWQADLVDILGTFRPVMVRMDQSKPRRRKR